MAKRRSSTRVGKTRPSAAALARRLAQDAELSNAAAPSAARRHIVTRPLLLNDVVIRWTLGRSEQVEIQEWTTPYWRPSLLPLHALASARPAPRELLVALRIPRSDWHNVGLPKWERPLLRRIASDTLQLDDFAIDDTGEKTNDE